MTESASAPNIPSHLKKYIVEQNYQSYTSEDQEVWRFIMRQLKSFLSVHAHKAYLSGLEKTGISTESIPKISDMDEKLMPYGWRAVPVSGFIPPAAFMEFQARSILPIASDMRTVDHILYTPAPDIVHEAAGHAPILIDPDFTKYLRSYGEVASKSILSSEDLALYEAIRDLSDVKESPESTLKDIQKSESHLEKVIQSMTYVSEAQYLGRMNWWTAEYGLIGDLDQPKIFGAGLLSSIDEARNALVKPEKKILDIHCLDFSYDITEQQPQLFVTPTFKNLIDVLDEMSKNLAFKLGGEEGLKRAQKAQTVCTVILEGGLSYSGIVLDFKYQEGLKSLRLKGPVQVCNADEFVELIESPDYDINFNDPIQVTSVHGGPKYFEHFPMTEDFVASRVPVKKRSDYDLRKFEAYSQIRKLRMEAESSQKFDSKLFQSVLKTYFEGLEKEWLMAISLLELSLRYHESSSRSLIQQLNTLSTLSQEERKCIDLAHELFKNEGLL